MAAVAGLRTATSMLYYSAQRYDPQLRQQQPTLLSTAPLNLQRHIPTSFTGYIPSVFSGPLLATRLGAPSLLRDASTASSSNHGSSSRCCDEYSGRISALTNTAIFGSDDTSLTSFPGDDPASVKEPDSGEQRTPSIESMLHAMQLGERVSAPPPSSVIRQCGDAIEEADKGGKVEEILEQLVSPVLENPGLALETSNSPSNILDQHPEYDSVYDYSEENETISDFLMGQDPDDGLDDTYSFGQSISTLDTQVSVPSNHANIVSSPNRPSSVASSSSSTESSIRFRPIESSTPRRRASILSIVYEQQSRVTLRGSTSFNPNDTAVPFRKDSFVDPASVPLPPTPRAREAVVWWKSPSEQRSQSSSRFCSGSTSRRQPPESTIPDVPSQSICAVDISIATPDENAGTHPPLPPSPSQSPAHGIYRRSTRIKMRKVISAILPCIPILRERQEPDGLGKAEPKEKSRSRGIFPIRLGHRLKKHKSGTPKPRDMVEAKSQNPLQVKGDR